MMKFSKKKSIIAFILTLVVIAGCCYTAGFGIGKKQKMGAAENIILGLDLKGGVSITYEVVDNDFTKTEFDDTMYKLELRVNDYSNEAAVYKEGDDKITVDIPGADNAEEVLEKIGKPGSLYFATEVSEDDPLEEGEQSTTINYGGEETEFKIWVTGEQVDVADARIQQSENGGKNENVVALTFDKAGAEAFKEATTEYLNKPIYIIYDGEIISAPNVESVISDGSAVINGQDTFKDAEALASNIRIGSLSLELKEVSSKVVGAKLGKDAIKTSLFAGAIGLVIVMLFMIFAYRVPGFAASIALIMYVALELLILNAFNMTLTLPGIAGIILSIGMAVDANVIIFARIREELGAGRNVESAITTGFKKATSAIVDGNITTFIASLVLMWLGTGPVQGFAKTLAIGIIISMFTAMVVSRLLVVSLYKMGCTSVKLYGVTKERKTVNFLSKKIIFFALSIVIIVGGIATMVINQVNDKGSLNFSIEFKGGISTTVNFDKDYSIEEFNDKMKPELAEAIGSTDIQGQKVRGSKELVIKTPFISDTNKRAAMREVLVKYGADESSIEESNISASVGKEMKKNATIAVIIATICMLAYIWIRFKNFKFATSAVLALVHDVLVVLGFYAVSRTTAGTTFIACMLTIVGYSINATIVIFDRIRENLAANKNEDLEETVNKSITQTLTRSIYTSVTTFVMVAVLYILGVTAIREFALPIMVGIVCGAYSSVCITGALWHVMSKKSMSKVSTSKKSSK